MGRDITFGNSGTRVVDLKVYRGSVMGDGAGVGLSGSADEATAAGPAAES